MARLFQRRFRRPFDVLRTPVKKILILVGTTVGSSIGWWLGAYAGTMTAYMLSMVGLGIGMWVGARMAKQYEP